MKRPAFSSLLLVFGVLLVYSCRSDERPNRDTLTFEDYYARYLEETREIKAHAFFQKGDSLEAAMPLFFPQGVTFLGNAMSDKKLPDEKIRYTYLNNGMYPGTFRYSYQSANGPKETFGMEMTPIASFIIKDSIRKSSGMTIVVDEGKLSEQESYVLLFSDENNKATTISIAGPSKSNEHFIPPQKLVELTTGIGQLYLVKKKNISRAEGDRRIKGKIEFYSKVIDIAVKD